jgi:hypothetical protein
MPKRYKPFDFTTYRTQNQTKPYTIEIDPATMYTAEELRAHDCMMQANPTLLREALQRLMRELIDLAKHPESDPEFQFDRVCEIEYRFNHLVELAPRSSSC